MPFMKAQEIQELFNSFEYIAIEYDGVECWSARELAPVMGYVQWRNFQSIIEKAKESADNAGELVSDHFADVSKMVPLGSGAEQMTSVNVQQKDLRGQMGIEREHIDNNSAVRGMLLDRGIRPEALPPAEDVKKVERRLKSDEKKIGKTAKKLPKSKK